ncbi:MAG: hypothetical protein NTU62_08665 [Spirochaetes bacterium]|nr:hypothetical protein [Spirochaetota bacterium]
MHTFNVPVGFECSAYYLGGYRPPDGPDVFFSACRDTGPLPRRAAEGATGFPYDFLDLPRRAAFPLLDASATVDNRRLTVFVINRDYRESQETAVDVSGFEVPRTVQIHTVCAKDCLARNTADRPEEAIERVTEAAWRGTLAFPPCSVTALVLQKSTSPELDRC